MRKEDIDKYVLWYTQKRPLYLSLAEKLKALITEVLGAEKINYSNVESRAKGIVSFENKLKNLRYKPEEMQDLTGIRIIGYVSSDVDGITKVIKKLFEIDEKNSVDKSQILGIDKVGYRSVHFVARIPKDRLLLPEWKQFDGLLFEIQIRTILQHAWAEIEHDRNYKFSGILPDQIKRRFSLLAGLLEVADNEFENISKSIEEYSRYVSEKTKAGKLDIVIDSTSLMQYLIDKFGDLKAIKPNFGPDSVNSKILIKELNDMGIKTLEDLDKIIPSNFREKIHEYQIHTNFSGMLREILILHDASRYFESAWKKHWGMLSVTGNFFNDYDIDITEFAKKYHFELTYGDESLDYDDE